MEVIGTPDFNYLDGWVNTFGNIVYILLLNLFYTVSYSDLRSDVMVPSASTLFKKGV